MLFKQSSTIALTLLVHKTLLPQAPGLLSVDSLATWSWMELDGFSSWSCPHGIRPSILGWSGSFWRYISNCFVVQKKLNSQSSYFYATTTCCFTYPHPSPKTLPWCRSLHIPILPIPPQSPLPSPKPPALPLHDLNLKKGFVVFV